MKKLVIFGWGLLTMTLCAATANATEHVVSSACNLIPDDVLAAQNISRQEIVSEVSLLSKSLYGSSQDYYGNACNLLTEEFRLKDGKKLGIRPKMTLISYTKIRASDADTIMKNSELYANLAINAYEKGGYFPNHHIKFYNWKGSKEVCGYSDFGNTSSCIGIRGNYFIIVNYVVSGVDDVEKKRLIPHNLLEKVSDEIKNMH